MLRGRVSLLPQQPPLIQCVWHSPTSFVDLVGSELKHEGAFLSWELQVLRKRNSIGATHRDLHVTRGKIRKTEREALFIRWDGMLPVLDPNVIKWGFAPSPWDSVSVAGRRPVIHGVTHHRKGGRIGPIRIIPDRNAGQNLTSLAAVSTTAVEAKPPLWSPTHLAEQKGSRIFTDQPTSRARPLCLQANGRVVQRIYWVWQTQD